MDNFGIFIKLKEDDSKIPIINMCSGIYKDENGGFFELVMTCDKNGDKCKLHRIAIENSGYGEEILFGKYSVDGKSIIIKQIIKNEINTILNINNNINE